MIKSDSEKLSLVSFGLSVAALLAVLPLGLLSALLAGLLVFNTVVSGARILQRNGIMPNNKMAKIILVVAVSIVVISLFASGGIVLAAYINNGPESVVGLIKHMADIVVSARNSMPQMIQDYLPSSVDAWQASTHEWLLSNAKSLSALGRNAGLFLVHIVFGMIIGGMMALHVTDRPGDAPLTRALDARARLLNLAFHRVFFSQVRISALNTLLTFVFLAFVMPLLGYDLPLIRTMVLVTFIVGLMPIIGNIISNTIIVLISLGLSLGAAVAALAFLIGIHKLEYFINARIIGSRIDARAWEILTAMLVMDAAFGIPGLVAAPIYYAYLKAELADRKLV